MQRVLLGEARVWIWVLPALGWDCKRMEERIKSSFFGEYQILDVYVRRMRDTKPNPQDHHLDYCMAKLPIAAAAAVFSTA
jgi:hypothetical protein